MKKTVLIISFVVIGVLSMSFMIKPTLKDIDSSWKAWTTETLVNNDYGITLTLYSNGYVAIKSNARPEGGSYDIDRDNRITFEWEEGGTEKGFVTTVQTTTGKRIKSVVAKGITFQNVERFVIKR